jgi:hypothetical protein
MAINVNWSGITSGTDTGDNVEASLTTAFTSIQTETNSEIARIDAVTVAVNAEARLTLLETVPTLSVLSVTSNGLPLQTLVPDTATVLNYMETDLVDIGTGISHTLGTSHMLINTAGIYKIFGTVNLMAPVNDIIDIELYVDNLPTGFKASSIGRGTSSIVSFQHAFLSQFNINDDIDLYITSSGTEVTVTSSTITVESTEY